MRRCASRHPTGRQRTSSWHGVAWRGMAWHGMAGSLAGWWSSERHACRAPTIPTFFNHSPSRLSAQPRRKAPPQPGEQHADSRQARTPAAIKSQSQSQKMCWTQRGKHVSQGTRLFASSLAALHSRAAPLPKLAGRQPVQAALPIATSEPSCRRCVVRPARKFPLSLRLHADASLRTPCCRCQDEQALFLAHGLASCKASSWVLAVERAASAKLSEWLHFALRCGDRGARSRRFPRSPSRHRCSLQADIQARCVHPPHTSQARPQSADRACETHLAGHHEQSGTLIIMRSAMSCERDLINLTSILSNAVQAAIHEQSQDGRQCGERERERERRCGHVGRDALRRCDAAEAEAE